MAIETKLFGKKKNNEPVTIYTLKNSKGIEAEIIDFGACLTALLVPDKEGKKRDIVLGYDTLEAYETNDLALGATIGRNGNRIAGGKFWLNGKNYQLKINNGRNNLHSGGESYHYRMWETALKEEMDRQSVILSLVSPDGDQGFPGTFQVSVTYTLTEDNELQIFYEGVSDQDTIINMTNHSYFNLDGHDMGSVADHLLWIDADRYTEIDKELVPTGRLLDVKNTAFDFLMEKRIGEDINNEESALKCAMGYDHNMVLNKAVNYREAGSYQETAGGYRKAAAVRSEKSGIGMEVYTDLPGMQLYTANYMDDSKKGKGGVSYGKHSGVCFETQHFPDAPNHDNFPSSIVKAGDRYYTQTTFKFRLI